MLLNITSVIKGRLLVLEIILLLLLLHFATDRPRPCYFDTRVSVICVRQGLSTVMSATNKKVPYKQIFYFETVFYCIIILFIFKHIYY